MKVGDKVIYDGDDFAVHYAEDGAEGVIVEVSAFEDCWDVDFGEHWAVPGRLVQSVRESNLRLAS
jgi:hypothetical protein